jgi:hypothetical protein
LPQRWLVEEPATQEILDVIDVAGEEALIGRRSTRLEPPKCLILPKHPHD